MDKEKEKIKYINNGQRKTDKLLSLVPNNFPCPSALQRNDILQSWRWLTFRLSFIVFSMSD